MPSNDLTSEILLNTLSAEDVGHLEQFIIALSSEDRRFFSFLDRLDFPALLDPDRFHTVLVAKAQDGSIVGYGHLQKFPEPNKAHVGRLGIALLAEFRGTGLSASLMEALLRTARRIPLTKLWLSVHEDNVPAIRLYERFRFTTEGVFFREERTETGWVNVVSMALHLDRQQAEDTVPWSRPCIGVDETAAILRVCSSGWFSQGSVTETLERRLAEYTGAQETVMMSSGTACLYAAFGESFQTGDKVAFPSFTFVSTLNSALAHGIRPILVDVDPRTGNIDLHHLERILADDDSLKGLVTVDIAGLPVDPLRVGEVAARYDLTVIEDAAEALGATAHGSRIGSFGHATMFSFHAAKLATTIEGGAICTNDYDLAERLRKYRNHGERRGEKFVWDTYGLNFRITDLQSSMGLAQLDRLEGFLQRRSEIARTYRERLSDILEFQHVDSFVGVHPFMLLLAKLPSQSHRDRLLLELRREGITCRPAWRPLHQQPVFANLFPDVSLPEAERWGSSGLCLPIYNDMTLDTASRVADALRMWVSALLGP